MEPSGDSRSRRGVRSFVLRAGRLTPAQARALETLLPRFGIADDDEPLDAKTLFGRPLPLVLEIGFGDGAATWRMAEAEPEIGFLAVEVHPPGVGRLLQVLRQRGIENVRVHLGDAVPLLRERLADGSLQGVRIYFPDPWPKKRHHKRRLVQPDFISLLGEKLETGGLLHLATDWQPYADHMLEVLDGSRHFENLSPTGDWCVRPGWRPETKYERRGGRLGHDTRDLLFRRR